MHTHNQKQTQNQNKTGPEMVPFKMTLFKKSKELHITKIKQ